MNLPIPVNGTVFVEFEPRIERQTASGLQIPPPKHEGVPVKGEVLALPGGKDCVEISCNGELVWPVHVGDIVFYVDQRPDGFEFDGRKVVPIKLDAIVGVAKKP